MKNKICVVTGATAGIGKATARALAEQGAQVVVVGRNADKCKATIAEIKVQTGNTNVDFALADLSSQRDVRRLADELRSRYSRIDILVNNAGAFFDKRRESADGIEMTFALNHLNYFLLTNLLLDALKAAPAARVVNVSSAAHWMGWRGIDFDDIEGKKRYNGWVAYGQSKLANVMFTYELARRLQGTSVTVNVLHPGTVRTNFGRTDGNRSLPTPLRKMIDLFLIGIEEGAKTSIYLASSPDVERVTGQYFVNCKPASTSSVSKDKAAGERLWMLSEEMISSRQT
jgi:NAD(P)-dependent dehydrogenase (short-subunit alcohol dehydrogenase family)